MGRYSTLKTHLTLSLFRKDHRVVILNVQCIRTISFLFFQLLDLQFHVIQISFEQDGHEERLQHRRFDSQ